MAHLNFEALRSLHDYANNILNSLEVQQSLLQHPLNGLINELSEATLTMLDVCGNSIDVLLIVKEHLQHLQSTLRKMSSMEQGIDEMIAANKLLKKMLKTERSKCLRSLKGINHRFISLGFFPTDHNLNVISEMLREVRTTIVAIVQSLPSVTSMSILDRKSTKELFSAKFIGGRSRNSIGEYATIQNANKSLEAMEIAIENIQLELESMFRRLIQTRVSLLNMLTV